MDNYKEMYYKLFNKITDIIHELQLVQIEVEEAYILQSIKEKNIKDDETGETLNPNNDLYPR